MLQNGVGWMTMVSITGRVDMPTASMTSPVAPEIRPVVPAPVAPTVAPVVPAAITPVAPAAIAPSRAPVAPPGLHDIGIARRQTFLGRDHLRDARADGREARRDVGLR